MYNIRMTPSDFTKQFIEGYIFGDLETMSHSKDVPAGKGYGVVGYPMLGTIMSGMELMGGLLLPSAARYNPEGMRHNFQNYWNNYFAKEYPQYAGLGDLFYSLIRNGIAHIFIAKYGVIVNKLAGPAILIDQSKQEIYINPNELYKEFELSYVNQAKPILDGTATTTSMPVAVLQARIASLEASDRIKSQRTFNRLAALDPSILTIDYWAAIGWQPQSTRSSAITSRRAGPSGPLGHTTTQTTNPFSDSGQGFVS
jgi:hypothetical protein